MFNSNDFKYSIFFYYSNANASNVFSLYIIANNSTTIGNRPNTFISNNNKYHL